MVLKLPEFVVCIEGIPSPTKTPVNFSGPPQKTCAHGIVIVIPRPEVRNPEFHSHGTFHGHKFGIRNTMDRSLGPKDWLGYSSLRSFVPEKN